MPTLTVDIWSDVMCPFCYLGDSILEEALQEFPHRDHVEVRYHSFQLSPELSDQPISQHEHLGDRFPAEQLDAMHEQFNSRGTGYGIAFNFDTAKIVNTHKAHELAHFAQAAGKGHDMNLRLFKAHFTDGVNVADTDALVTLAEEAGLDGAAAREALDSGKHVSDVDGDIARARTLGITGVPFFVFAGQYAVSGAQPKEMFLQALNTAWNEIA